MLEFLVVALGGDNATKVDTTENVSGGHITNVDAEEIMVSVVTIVGDVRLCLKEKEIL